MVLAYFRIIFAKVNSKRELGWQNKFPSGALLGQLCVRVHGVGVPFCPWKSKGSFSPVDGGGSAKMVGGSIARSDFRARYFVMAKFTLAICIGRR